jgi:hypothetical protein
LNPIQASLVSFLRQGISVPASGAGADGPGFGPPSVAPPSGTTNFHLLLGDLLALLSDAGQTASREPTGSSQQDRSGSFEIDASPRSAASDRVSEDEPPRGASDEPAPDPDPAADIAPVAPQPAPEATAPPAAQAPEVVPTSGTPEAGAPVSSDGGASEEGPPAPAPAPVERAKAPSESGAVTGFEVAEDPEGPAAPNERVLPQLDPPRRVPQTLLSGEARVLFDAEAPPPGADPTRAGRGPAASSVEPYAASPPPTSPATGAPPEPPPGLEVAAAAVAKGGPPQTSNVFEALERALGIALEEVLPPDAGTTSGSSGGSTTGLHGTTSPPGAVLSTASGPPGAATAQGEPAVSAAGWARRAGGIDATVQSAPPASGSDAAERAEFIERIVRAARLARHGAGARLQIVLRPPELGRLRVELLTREGALEVRIGADRAGAAELVQSNLGALREALQEQGLRVGELRVSVDGDGSGSQPQQQADDRDPSFAEIAGIPEAFLGDEPGPGVPAAARVLTSALVDLLA